MAASLLSFDVATCVDRCRFATGCCETHCNGCMMLHGLCVGEEAGARNLVFFLCKVAAAGDESYLVCAAVAAGSFCARIVPPMCFATSGCVCVRSSMRFLNLWLQLAL